jgi:isopenicillin-N epimerase
VGAEARDLVLVPNATTALNAVIQSVPLQEGETVLIFDTTYASVKKMVRKVCKERGATVAEKKLPPLGHHLTHDLLLDAILRLIPDNCKLVVLDHISSNEALLLPLHMLVPACQARGALVLVDGAHGLSATDLNLAAIGACVHA